MADAYIGYRSAGRRPEQYNDRTASANAPLSAIRGYLAGTAGLPGDLEGLARAGLSQVPPELLRALPGARMFGLGARVDQTPSMPTSEFYNEYLPKPELNQTPTGKLFTGAGNLMGGAYSTNLARAGIKGIEGLASMAERVLAEAPRSGSRAAQRGVIKMKGGNWLAGSVEDSLKPLKTEPLQMDRYAIRDAMSPEDLGRYFAAAEAPGVTDLPSQLKAAGLYEKYTAPTDPVNNWVDKTLTKYVKNEMATPEDSVRALAERGVLHVNPDELNFILEKHGKYMQPGQTAVAKSEAAKVWEGASDMSVESKKASDYLMDSFIEPGTKISPLLDNNSWLAKVPPETQVHNVYDPNVLINDLGFDHLIDELRNATNPASGLPANLLLKPEALSRVTMPQAVERVAKINAWRMENAAQMKLEQTLAADLYKEYPEQGMRWVELNKPGQFAAESDAMGHSVRGYEPPEGGGSSGYGLGGWDAIQSGKAKVYSLRDAKGQPHTTIEVGVSEPLPEKFSDIWDIAMKHVPEESAGWDRLSEYGDPYDVLKAYFGKRSENPKAVIEGILEYFPEAVDATMADLAKRESSVYINQIKGKGNKKPNDEYLPFVQDFVKSKQWSDINDLHNTGLMSHLDAYDYLHDIEPARAYNFMDNSPGEGFWTEDELSKFANGGYVAYDPQQVDRIVHGFAEGGSIIKNAATDFMKFLDDQGLSMSDVVAAFGKRGLPLSAAFYSGGLNTDEDLELRKRRKQKPTIDEPKFAQGGSVSAYDPSRVDAIVNEFM